MYISVNQVMPNGDVNRLAVDTSKIALFREEFGRVVLHITQADGKTMQVDIQETFEQMLEKINGIPEKEVLIDNYKQAAELGWTACRNSVVEICNNLAVAANEKIMSNPVTDNRDTSAKPRQSDITLYHFNRGEKLTAMSLGKKIADTSPQTTYYFKTLIDNIETQIRGNGKSE